KFFLGKEPPNDNFMRQIFKSTPQEGVTRMSLRLPLQKLTENSTVTDMLGLLYSEPTLYFAVAHDAYVSKTVHLDVELSVESCTDTDHAPSIERHEQEIPLDPPGEHP